MHTSGLSFTQLMQAIEHRKGIVDVACPLCGPDRLSASNRIRKVMRVWNLSPGFVGYAGARCGETGYARNRSEPRVNSVVYTRVQTELDQRHREEAAMRRSKALR